MKRDWGARGTFNIQLELAMTPDEAMAVVLGDFARSMLGARFTLISNTNRSASFARRKANVLEGGAAAVAAGLLGGVDDGLLIGALTAGFDHHKDSVAVTVLGEGSPTTVVSLVGNGPTGMKQEVAALTAELAAHDRLAVTDSAGAGAALGEPADDVLCPRCETRPRLAVGWCAPCHDSLRPCDGGAVAEVAAALTAGDVRKALRLIDRSYVQRNTTTGASVSATKLKFGIRAVRTAYPDMRWDYDAMYADPEDARLVWVVWNQNGTSRGGKPFRLRAVEKFVVVVGQVQSSWLYPELSSPPAVAPATMRQLPAVAPANMKTCPDCAEQVLVAARVCRYCGFRFDGA